jgi:ribosomal protein S18 acetylase RimI-like enzyme
MKHKQQIAFGREKYYLRHCKAESDNQSARVLYEKISFRVVKEFEHPDQLPLTGSAGCVRMIKEL